MKAADVMVTQIITAHPEDRVEEIAHKLVANRISGLPVLDDSGALVGIVSEGDLMRRPESGTEHRRSWWLDMLTTRDQFAAEYVKERGKRTGDVMTRKVITVSPDTELGEVADLLEAHVIKRVPVVEDGALVGIVSRANLIQALAALHNRLPVETNAQDAQIREEVTTRLRREPWTPMLLNVIVKDGAVALWGYVRSEEEKNAARVAAETATGAKSVDDNIIVISGSTWGV